jgi:hypothetical protein
MNHNHSHHPPQSPQTISASTPIQS